MDVIYARMRTPSPLFILFSVLFHFFWTLEQLWIKQWHVHACRLTLPSKQSHLHLRLADGENSQTAPKTNGMIEFIDLRNPLLDSQSNYNLDTRVMN
jgi:hypothetical protein